MQQVGGTPRFGRVAGVWEGCARAGPCARVRALAHTRLVHKPPKLPNLPTWFGKWWGYLNKYFGGSFAS
jgi:hypothetical protein